MDTIYQKNHLYYLTTTTKKREDDDGDEKKIETSTNGVEYLTLFEMFHTHTRTRTSSNTKYIWKYAHTTHLNLLHVLCAFNVWLSLHLRNIFIMFFIAFHAICWICREYCAPKKPLNRNLRVQKVKKKIYINITVRKRNFQLAWYINMHNNIIHKETVSTSVQFKLFDMRSFPRKFQIKINNFYRMCRIWLFSLSN